ISLCAHPHGRGRDDSFMLFKLLIGFFFVLIGALSLPSTTQNPIPPNAAATTTAQGRMSRAQPAGCTLTVPYDPLSARGLATPYVLAGPCRENDPNTNAFVQAVILNRATGAVSLYDPLVVDRGTRPAIRPVAPTLPSSRVVAIWVGFNGDTLSLVGPGRRACVDGVQGSVLGQNA